jgi:hypothetical protein
MNLNDNNLLFDLCYDYSLATILLNVINYK